VPTSWSSSTAAASERFGVVAVLDQHGEGGVGVGVGAGDQQEGQAS
jgi:hypothetical protein